MTIQNPVVPAPQGETRLRIVRYFSDQCAEKVDQAIRQAHLDEVHALEAKSDDELLQLGILRDEIFDHVFSEARFV